MNTFRFFIITNTILLAVSTVGTIVSLQHSLIFMSVMLSVVCILTIINIFRLQTRQTRMFANVIECISKNDFASIVKPPFRDKDMVKLSNSISSVVQALKENAMNEQSKYHYYENLMNNVDTAVVTTDKNGRILWMNKYAASILGADTFKLPEDIQSAINSHNKIIHRKNRNTTLELSISSVEIIVKGMKQYIITLNNIHYALERKEMEAWQKLIRVLTHEIMNSITPIISLSETLKERSKESDERGKNQKAMVQGLDIINRRCKGLMEFVDNYRKLTRISSPIRSEINVKDFFNNISVLMASEYIYFSVQEENMNWNADRVQMEQVFLNILKNAIEACKNTELPEITVSANYVNDKYIRFLIKDNGEGIMPEVKERIFVPFFTTKPEGSGIGLSLCKQIITLHNGNINVDSEIGKGTAFSIIMER